jgi:hypothetical protein
MAIIKPNNNTLSSITALPTGVGGKVLQVVQATTSSQFSTTSTSFVDVTGFVKSITPSSTSNKILVSITFRFGATGANSNRAQIRRASTSISLGSTQNNLSNVWTAHGATTQGGDMYSINYIDSPSTTSSTEYALQVSNSQDTSGLLTRVNGRNDGSANSAVRGSITLMEIAG